MVAKLTTSGSVHPWVPPISRPITSAPIVTASRSAPATSIRAGRRGNGRSSANQLTALAIAASGTLMKKIHGHDHCSMMNPPISGPSSAAPTNASVK